MSAQAKRITGIWMRLKDRKRLAKIMAIQDVSARGLADAIGWKSHSYMNRLLNGQAKTCSSDSALAIAYYLGVPQDVLFVTEVSTADGRNIARKKAS